MKVISFAASLIVALNVNISVDGFSLSQPAALRNMHPLEVRGVTSSTKLSMAMDDAMLNRLEGIKRSYQALTERLGDPDVISDSNLLMKIMSDRSKSEDVVNNYDEVSQAYVTLFDIANSLLSTHKSITNKYIPINSAVCRTQRATPRSN
jgi:hypothetical protein